MKKAIQIGEVIVSLWLLFIFLSSLPFKFTGAPETQFIFGTIGAWLEGFLGQAIGQGFASYAGYVIGSFELVASLLIITAIYFTARKMHEKASLFFGLGGLLAFFLMFGAAFFHLFSPLGIDVNGDGGSLFRAAVSIVFIGGAFFAYNAKTVLASIKK